MVEKPKFEIVENFNDMTHCAKDLLIVKKIKPNLISSKTVPIGCADLNSKIKFAICHWTWEIHSLKIIYF